MLLLAIFLFFAPVQAERGAPLKFQNVTVKPGDTLWSIANAYLKNPTSWSELLKYNKLPSSDPTVALPGMTLKVPILLIKENLRAAILEYMANNVLSRKKESADWNPSAINMQLMRDDGLRTLASSRARVRFVNGDLLSLDQNSMAIIKPLEKDYDLELMRGEVHTMHSSVVTASARITPKTKDTKYSAKVAEDLSTRVEVYTGKAEVEGSGKKVEVPGGFLTEVPLGRVPSLPSKLPKLPDYEATLLEGASTITTEERPQQVQALSSSAGPFRVLVKSLSIGVPVAAYRVQACKTKDCPAVVFDKTYDVDEAIDFQRINIPSGRYFWRVAVIDLLGVEGKFTAPEEYSLGGKSKDLNSAFTARFELLHPATREEQVKAPKYRIIGRSEVGVKIEVNGQRVGLDEEGMFSKDILLKEGDNEFRVTAVDTRGNESVFLRTVSYQP